LSADSSEESEATHGMHEAAYEPPTEPLASSIAQLSSSSDPRPSASADSSSSSSANPSAEPPPKPAESPIPLETNPAYIPPLAATPVPPTPVPPLPPAPPPARKPELPPAKPIVPTPLAASLSGPFSQMRYRFTTGLRAGEVANIRSDDGRVLLSYRSFASAVGIIAALVSAIVALAGLAAVLFLFNEGYPLRAVAALALTIVFAVCIALLVPRVNVTLYDEHHPAIMLTQLSHFPGVRYQVGAPNGSTLAELRKAPFSRLGRHRWSIVQDGRMLAEAREESWSRAMVRKILGKFSRRFETNFLLEYGGLPAGRIVRRPDGTGAVDLLELTHDALDRRVAVALATAILGREP